MPQIVFFCPPVSVINGGIRHIFRMADCLRAQGHDAVVFEQNAARPAWFPSTVPVMGQDILRPYDSPADAQIYVLPEDQPQILAAFAEFPQRKVIYSQNHFYGALGIGAAADFAAYGIMHMLCSSRTIYEHARLRHPGIPASVIPCAVDPALFRPAPVKQKVIAYMPRKRAIEAAYIRDMFRFGSPQRRDWQWRELSNLSETAVAAALGEAAVFLSLSRLEGFGLTPLEAMAAGCIVAGFTGIGGREYASDRNGFWADEDDFPACVAQLARAAELALGPEREKTAYTAACRETLSAYTPESFSRAVAQAWNGILAAAI